METQKNHSRPFLMHDPLGIEQPYYQKSHERFPRYPAAGEPTAVGCLPVGCTAETMQLHWSTDEGTTWSSVDAFCHGGAVSIGEREERQAWLAVIPGSPPGKRVDYRFTALTGNGTVESDRFSYVPAEKSRFRWVGFHLPGDPISDKPDSVMSQPQGVPGDGSALKELSLPDGRLTALWLSDDGRGLIEFRFFPGQDDDPAALPLQIVPMLEPADPSAVRGADCCTHGQYRFESLADGSGFRVVSNTPARGEIELLRICESPEVLHTPDRELCRIDIPLQSGSEERFYGFGERFNRLNQAGRILESVVYEQYRRQGLKSYLPVPFFFSSAGRGLSIADDHRITFDLDHGRTGKTVLRIETEPGGAVSALLTGGTPAEMVRAHACSAGLPAMPPEWVFGPWMSSNEWNTQERVLAEARKTRELDIPATVLVIEAWSDEHTFYIWNGAGYRPEGPERALTLADFDFGASSHWPDPRGMIRKLHDQELKVILWQIPALKAAAPGSHSRQEADLAYAVKKGYCVREQDGSPYRIRPGWFHGGLLLDFTNPEAVDWWFSRRSYLLEECGVDGFKTDGGEHLWGEATRFADGRRGAEMINGYPDSYIGAYHSFLRKSGIDGVTFSRAGCRGAHRFPCHWAGDQDSTWEAFRGVISAVLNAGLSGIPFMGWDIGGFSGRIPDSELYLRSVAAAALSPVMQYHSEYNDHREPPIDRTPWNIAACCGDPQVITVYRMYAHLRMKLIPYLKGEAEYCCRRGEPLLRPLFIDNPEDPEAWEREGSYRLGRALLAAPVLYPGLERLSIYLPEGEWIDAWTGEVLQGPQRFERNVPLPIIPLYRDISRQWPLSDTLFSDALAEAGLEDYS